MSSLRFVEIHPNDELAQPLIAELAVEYATRYDGTEAGMLRWLQGYPAEEFSPPDGGMLIGLLDSVPVTGGAFRRFGVVDGTETAELKRIWTDSRYRRRGYGRILLAELEARIASLGYRRSVRVGTPTRRKRRARSARSRGPSAPQMSINPVEQKLGTTPDVVGDDGHDGPAEVLDGSQFLPVPSQSLRPAVPRLAVVFRRDHLVRPGEVQPAESST